MKEIFKTKNNNRCNPCNLWIESFYKQRLSVFIPAKSRFASAEGRFFSSILGTSGQNWTGAKIVTYENERIYQFGLDIFFYSRGTGSANDWPLAPCNLHLYLWPLSPVFREID